MSLISDNYFHVIKHFFHSPGQIIGYNHNRDVDLEGSFCVVDQLDVMRLYIRVPPFDLVLPVNLQSGRTYDQQRPLMLVNVSHSEGLNSLSDSHFIGKEHSSMFLYAKLQTLLLEVKKFFIERQRLRLNISLDRIVFNPDVIVRLQVYYLNLL